MLSKNVALKKWFSEAAKLEPKPLAIPLVHLLADAKDVAELIDQYWEPTAELPGLNYAGSSLPPNVGGEIRELIEAVEEAEEHCKRVITEDYDLNLLMQRGLFLLGEISAAMEWCLCLKYLHEDHVIPKPGIVEIGSDINSPKELSRALSDFAKLGVAWKSALIEFGGFDLSYLDEATDIAARLETLEHTYAPDTKEAREAVAQRDQLSNLLLQRLRLVRAAARFVFRHHSDIVRKFGSQYTHRLHTARRRAEIVGHVLQEKVVGLGRRKSYAAMKGVNVYTPLRFVPYV